MDENRWSLPTQELGPDRRPDQWSAEILKDGIFALRDHNLLYGATLADSYVDDTL